MLRTHKGEGILRPHFSELVINWHMTEACNYRCRYCYAKWDGDGKELLHDWHRAKKMLDEVHAFFHPCNMSNPLQNHMSWAGVRLNLAGGEPLLYPDKVLHALTYAASKGMRASIITNGSRLTADLIDDMAPHISMLGLSLDSINSSRNVGIGRVDSRGNLLDIHGIAELLARAKLRNPELLLKINTVVNALNHEEDMKRVINLLSPHRWKVLRMLPLATKALAVSSEDFAAFVARHEAFNDVMRVEDNDDMCESYIMIDPHGRFYQSTKGQQGYHYSPPIHLVGARCAFDKARLSPGSYASRYLRSVAKE